MTMTVPVAMTVTVSRLRRSKALHRGGRTAASRGRSRRRSLGDRVQMFGNRLFVKFIRRALFDNNRPLRTMTETSANAVTKVFGDQFRLAVDQLNRPFGTRRDAQAAAVTFFFIDMDNFTNHQ
jgi:hypothetical protein